MRPMSLQLFGNVKLRRGISDKIMPPNKTQWLLAYLASNSSVSHSREQLAGFLWGEHSDEHARHSLRRCLFTLAKAIGEKEQPLVHADRQWVACNVAAIDVDVWKFERLMGQDTPAALEEAVHLYRADFLSEMFTENETLNVWCLAERTRLRDLCYDCLAKLASYCADTAQMDEAIASARRLTSLDALREDDHRTLIRLLNRAGRRAEAMRQYRSCVEILHRELGVEPAEATRELLPEIRGSVDSDDARRGPPVPASVTKQVEPSTLSVERLHAVVKSKTFAAAMGAATAAVFFVLWFGMMQ